MKKEMQVSGSAKQHPPVVELRKIRTIDLPIVYTLFKDDNILRNLLIEKTAKTLTLYQEKKWLLNAISHYRRRKPSELTLAVTVDKRLIGVVSANLDHHNKSAEIGYWIGKRYWGKGLMTEAIKQFTNLLLYNLKFVRVEARPFSKNKSSHRVLEKAGYKLEGERKKAIKKFDDFINDKIYAKVI